MISETRQPPFTAIKATKFVLLVAAIACGQSALAAEPYIYPANGQTPELQEQDKYSCYQFGKTQSGFDPMKAQTASAPPPTRQGGALKGAAGGAIIGGIADGSDGAKTGAAIGATLGAMRRRGSQKKQEQALQQQAAIAQQNRDNYDRAFSACMQGRGYTLG